MKNSLKMICIRSEIEYKSTFVRFLARQMAAQLQHLVFILLIVYCQTVVAIEDDYKGQDDQFKANSPAIRD
jgi:hypothetical protein